MNDTKLVLSMALLAALFGCGVDNGTGNKGKEGDGDIVCIALYTPSVIATIVDVSSDPLPDATVTYMIDDAGPYPADDSYGNNFIAGYETTGDFVVMAEHDGYSTNTGSATVVMDDAGCHVLTQEIEIALTPP